MKEIGNKLAIAPGEYVNCNGQYFRYIGKFNSIDEVPKINCLFVIGSELFRRTVTPAKQVESRKKDNEKTKEDTSGKLNIQINSADNELMIDIKELLKDFTKNDFKKLFTNETEMNNMKRVLETTNDLSWKRFILMLELLNMKHTLVIEEKEDSG